MKRFIIPVFLILLSSAIYVVYIDGFWKDIAADLAKREELQAIIEKANEANEKIDRYSRKYASISPDALRRLDVMLPPETDPTLLIVDVNTVAGRSGLSIKGITVTSKKDEKTLGATHSIRFTVTAPYVVFNAFLLDLERSLALRDLNGLSFKSSAEGGVRGRPSTMISEYSVDINTYSLR